MIDDKSIEDAIKIIRESFAKLFQLRSSDDIDKFFIYGGCLYFAIALKRIFPEARLYRNIGHVVIKIGNKYYDYQGHGNLGEPAVPIGVKICEDGIQYEDPYFETNIKDIVFNYYRHPQIEEKALAASALSADIFEIQTYKRNK